MSESSSSSDTSISMASHRVTLGSRNPFLTPSRSRPNNNIPPQLLPRGRRTPLHMSSTPHRDNGWQLQVLPNPFNDYFALHTPDYPTHTSTPCPNIPSPDPYENFIIQEKSIAGAQSWPTCYYCWMQTTGLSGCSLCSLTNIPLGWWSVQTHKLIPLHNKHGEETTTWSSGHHTLWHIGRSLQHPANLSQKAQWSLPKSNSFSGWCRSISTTAPLSLIQLWHIFTISSIRQNKSGKSRSPKLQYSSFSCTSKACIHLFMRHYHHQHSWTELSHLRHLRTTCTIFTKQKQHTILIISHSPAYCPSMTPFCLLSPVCTPHHHPHCSSFTSLITPMSQHLPEL